MRVREWLGVGERRWKKAPDEEVQPAKTLWDWLQLLIVPAILVAVTFAWSATQTRSDNKREDQRIAEDRRAAEEARQDATLQGYLKEMSGLVLDKNLLISKWHDAVRAVARADTLTALRRLDGERKGAVVRFLAEAGLLDPEDPKGNFPFNLAKVDLEDADLTGADLKGAHIAGVNLTKTNLTGAHLEDAHVEDANFAYAKLKGAHLEGAQAEGVNFLYANLAGANLAGAYLRDAVLDVANFAGANLRAANLAHATLLYAKHLDLHGVRKLDLDRYINTELRGLAKERKRFLREQWHFLVSRSPAVLATFNLSPDKLAALRREVRGP
jgi:uncharacterized protein YjbI with pentapeptide repeats